MLSYYPNVLANQLFVAHAEIQNQNSSFFKTAPPEMALLNYLYFKCAFRHTITASQTSKRLGGKGGGAYEVNRMSFLSSYQWDVLAWRSSVQVWNFHLQLPRRHTTKI